MCGQGRRGEGGSSCHWREGIGEGRGPAADQAEWREVCRVVWVCHCVMDVALLLPYEGFFREPYEVGLT
jgi:hypothetical protein